MKKTMKYVRSTTNYHVFQYTDHAKQAIVSVYLESRLFRKDLVCGEVVDIIVSSAPQKKHECDCKFCLKKGLLEE